MNQKINDIEFTIFDVETTGLESGSGDRVIEIAAVRIKNKEILGQFQSLLNPGYRAIAPAAFAVNQISSEMLKEAPEASQILPEFLEFISGSCLASYNAPFDISFLSSELRLINHQLPPGLQIVDVLTMAKKILPNLKRYKLWIVAKYFGINIAQEHRALSDSQLTVEVFHCLNAKLAEKGITDFEQFVSLFGLNSELLDSINSAKIARIQQALDLGANLKITYLSRHNSQLTEREVIPRKVVQERNQLYLIGYCNLRSQERTFKIANILHLEMNTSSV